jgi:hypothetical protein
MTADRLIAAAREGFAAAGKTGVTRQVDGQLAGRSVRLKFAGDFFDRQLTRALAIEPLPTSRGTAPATEAPQLTLHAWDAASTGVRLASDSWAGMMINPSSVIDDLSDDRYQVSLELHGALASILDRHTGEAYHYVPDPSRLPAWETTHPARMLLAAWARAQGLVTCHAAAVAADDDGLLLCGPSGAGKSTTTLAALAAGMSSAGDDYILVEPGSPPRAHALYRSTLLEIGNYERNQGLMPVVDHVADQVDRRKAVMFAVGADRPAVAGGFKIRGIVALNVVPGSQPTYRRTTGAAALRALAPSTLGQLGMVDAAGLARLANLCRVLPAFELRLGDDPTPVPDILRSMIEEASRAEVLSARG